LSILVLITISLVILWRYGALDCDVDGLAAALHKKVLVDATGKHVKVASGWWSTVYSLTDDHLLRVQRSSFLSDNEIAVGESLPETPVLLPLDAVAMRGTWPISCSGEVTRRVHGYPAQWVVGKLSIQQILHLAIDVAVALHAMHTKIRGYVVLHCDLHAGNVLVTSRGTRAVVTDYGSMLVHSLLEGEPPTGRFFREPFHFCRQGLPGQGDSLGPSDAPYGVGTDWQNLGLLSTNLLKVATNIQT